MPRTSWVDRTFEFALPDDAWPALIERLRVMPARVEAVVAGLDPEVVARRDGDRWSIQEHAGHLADLDAALFRPRLDDFDAGAPVLRAADMGNRLTEEARHNERPLADVIGGFKAGRAAIVGRLEPLSAAAFVRRSMHPRLKRSVRLLDLMEFQAEHDDHHLASVLLLRARWTAPTAA